MYFSSLIGKPVSEWSGYLYYLTLPLIFVVVARWLLQMC